MLFAEKPYTCIASTCNVLCTQTVDLPLIVAMESTTPLNNGCLSSVASTMYVYKIFTYKLTYKGEKMSTHSHFKIDTQLPNIAAVASNLERDFTLPACMCQDQRFAKMTIVVPCDSCTTVWNAHKYVWTDSPWTSSDKPVERYQSIVYTLIKR